MNDLRTIAAALGGEVCNQQVLAPGPGHSPRDRSLAVRLSANAAGFVCHSHAGDDWQICVEHVRARLGLRPWKPGDEQDRRRVHPIKESARPAVDREAERRPRSEDDLLRIKRAVAIWNEATDPRETAVEKYLQARCLNLDDDIAGGVLRFHPRCPWRNENTGKTERIPALIVAFRSIDDGIITAIHRIRVDQPERWPKTERRMFGIVHRAAVMLEPIGPKLAIGEGTETAMAARQLGVHPTWALGSAGNIAGFPVRDDVRHLVILAETGKASRDAIQFCGPRWKKAGRKVTIITPDVGSDLNDELMAGGLR